MGIVPLLFYLFVFVDLNLQWFESCYEWFVLCRLVAHNFNRKKTKVWVWGLKIRGEKRKYVVVVRGIMGFLLIVI